MLFHVTATHKPAECPAYNPDKMPVMMDIFERLDEICKQLNVKIHFMVNAAPEHVSYLLLEADNMGAVARLAHEFPFQQDFKVTPVQTQQQIIETAKAMMAKK